MRTDMKRLNIRASRGFTLLEVLITVVIFSIGLLGLAGLQATGIKLNHSSLLRTQATLLAYDAADSMRANRGAVADYAIAMSADKPPSNGTIVQQDVRSWLDRTEQMLPSADGSISVTGNRATITVRWDDTRGVGALKDSTLVTDI